MRPATFSLQARRDQPVLPRPDREMRHRRLVGNPRDRRIVDRVAGDPHFRRARLLSADAGEPGINGAIVERHVAVDGKAVTALLNENSSVVTGT